MAMCSGPLTLGSSAEPRCRLRPVSSIPCRSIASYYSGCQDRGVGETTTASDPEPPSERYGTAGTGSTERRSGRVVPVAGGSDRGEQCADPFVLADDADGGDLPACPRRFECQDHD